MTKEIKKVGVLGAGIMGSGIAAQLANAGYEVVLFDLPNENGVNNADLAVERLKKAKPTDVFNAGLMVPENAKNITTALSAKNMMELGEESKALLGECDWIVESVLVPQHVREAMYKAIEKFAKPDAIFSSNTSTIKVETIVEGQSDDFKSRFLNTHFFNPVRRMHLLEVIPGEHTDPQITQTMQEFGSRVMGKKSVICKDAPGFIGNRIGMFAMEAARDQSLKMSMDIEDVDSIMGQAFGFPKLGLFRLADEVGLPVIQHVRRDLNAKLPESDAFRQIFGGEDELKDLVDNGYLGVRGVYKKDGQEHETEGGYYRKKKDQNGNLVMEESGKKPLKEVRDLVSGQYRDFKESPYFRFEKKIKKYGGYDKFFDGGDEPAQFAWPVLRDTMLYVLNHAEEMAYDLQDIDDAMRAGFGWDQGPFELMDKFGVKWFTEKLEREGIKAPALLAKANKQSFYREANGQNQVMNFDGSYAPLKRGPGVLSLDDVKAASKPLITHNSASLWDIGDGVTALEFHSTKNAIDPSIFWVINESIKLLQDNPETYKGMVIYNDAPSFSFGANLKLVEVFMDATEDWRLKMIGVAGYVGKKLPKLVEELVYEGQAVYTALNQAPFPVVGAPKGNNMNFAFGGGNEILLSSDAIQAGPEQIMALPEPGLGLLPGWGGTARYLQRAFEKPGQKNGPMPGVIDAVRALADPANSGSNCSQDAKKKLWLSQDDGISMNPDRVLADAKAKVLAMAPAYAPKALPTYNLPGLSGKMAIRLEVDKMYNTTDDPNKGVNHIDVRVADALADVLTGGAEIKFDDVDHHVAEPAVAQRLKQIMKERGEDTMLVHPGIGLNFNRILQLERDRFVDRFNDKDTWKRVRHTMAKGVPLREQRPQPEPTPQEIRADLTPSDLPRRHITGKPLEGADADRLKAMAELTREFYKLNEARTLTKKVKQAPKTLSAVQHALRIL